MTLINKLRWPLLAPQDRVLVAVSGGPDSLCLLHVLWTEREARRLGSVTAAHLDHGLRGTESAAEADWVAAWCAERGISCHVGRVDLGARRSQSVQEAARTARYEFLEETAVQVGADKIATGHTQDDQTETVLANILRGTGLTGLRGIPEQRGRTIRPLLDVSRAEVEAYNAANSLMPRLDSSNLSAEHYTRNRIRLELLPELRQSYNSGIDNALRRLSEIAARDSDYLAVQAASALTAVTLTQDDLRLEMDREALVALHPSLLRHVLRQAVGRVRGTGEGMTYESLEVVCQAVLAITSIDFTLRLPAPSCRVRVTEQAVTLCAAAEQQAPAAFISAASVSVALPVPGEAVLEEIGWRVSAGWGEAPYAIALDADSVDLGSLHVRNRRTGDRVDPLGMGGRHKRISDIFTDAKVARSERDRIPIVADSQGILWVAGHTRAERAKVTAGTMRALFLSAKTLEGNSRSDRE